MSSSPRSIHQPPSVCNRGASSRRQVVVVWFAVVPRTARTAATQLKSCYVQQHTLQHTTAAYVQQHTYSSIHTAAYYCSILQQHTTAAYYRIKGVLRTAASQMCGSSSRNCDSFGSSVTHTPMIALDLASAVPPHMIGLYVQHTTHHTVTQ